MPSWRPLVALAIIAFFSLTLYPPSADAGFSGIFDNAAVTIDDLDDDLGMTLHRLRTQKAASGAVAGFDATAAHPLRLCSGFTVPGLVSWTGRRPVDRGPPTGRTRQQPCPPSALLDSTARSPHTPVLPDHRLRSERNAQWPS